MGSLSIWHWLLVLVVAMIFLGRGRVSDLMGDIGKGISSLRHGLADARNVETSMETEERLSNTKS